MRGSAFLHTRVIATYLLYSCARLLNSVKVHSRRASVLSRQRRRASHNPTRAAARITMKIFLVDDRLYCDPPRENVVRCPFCKKKITVEETHDCVSLRRQNKLIRAVGKFKDLPNTVCSACRRATLTESTDNPFFVKGVLSWKHHTLIENSIISKPLAPSTCVQCTYATREYSIITKCSCGRVCAVERRVQPIPTGPVLPTKIAPTSATLEEGCCDACKPLKLPKPHHVEKIVETLPHPLGTHVCFVCYSIGDWKSYYPVPSHYLIQRYHFWKRAPKFICTKCIKKCRLCTKPALGRDEVCTSCFYVQKTSHRN